jgi:uncharacterized protein YcfL
MTAFFKEKISTLSHDFMKHLKNSILLLPVVFFVGCASTVNTIEPASFGSQRTPVADRRIITNPNLNAIVDVVGVNESIVSGDLKKVSVELYNHRNGGRSFNYRFEWFDAAGNSLPLPSSGYVSSRIEGRETLSISSVAPSPRAVDFRLKLLNEMRK